MTTIKYMFYYPFVYSILLVILGAIYSTKSNKKIWLILSGVLAIIINVLTVHFLILNIGRKLGFDRFEFTPMIYTSYISIAVVIFSLILWRASKSWFPAFLILLLALVHIFVVWFLKFYHIR